MDIIMMRRYAELSAMADRGEALKPKDWLLIDALEKLAENNG